MTTQCRQIKNALAEEYGRKNVSVQMLGVIIGVTVRVKFEKPEDQPRATEVVKEQVALLTKGMTAMPMNINVSFQPSIQ